MNLTDLGQWYYLIYLLPLILSFFTLIASAFGASHRGGHGHGRVHVGGHHGGRSGPVSHPSGSGFRHDAHAGRATGSHAQSHSSTKHAPPTSHGSSDRSRPSEDPSAHLPHSAVSHVAPGEWVLGFFGIGRVPTLLLMQGFMLAWGAVGFYASRMMQAGGAHPAAFVLPALEMAAAGGVVGTKVIAAIGSRLMPSEETFVTEREDLLGMIGSVVYPVSAEMGRIHIYDAYGTLHDESARLCSNENETLPKGASVLLVDYDEVIQCYRVERSPV